MKKPTVVLIALLVFVCLAIVLALVGDRYLAVLRDPRRIEEWVTRWGGWAPLAMIVLHATQVILAPIPGQVLGLASGYLFGAFWGLIYSMIGSIIGSLVVMSLARRYGRPLVRRFVRPEALAQLDEGAKRGGLPFFFFVFLVPALPDDLACWAAGMTSLPISALMLAMIAGRTPGMLVSTLVGANAAGLSTVQWAIIIVLSVALGAIFILRGKWLQAEALKLVRRLSTRGQKDQSDQL